jgi:cytochrome c biogenesis protein CcmG, thiol:disulfide interchange protein DsbE
LIRGGGDVRMKKVNIKILVLVLVVGLFVYFGINMAVQPKIARVGDKAADFELEDLDGNIVKLSDYKGQVVVLNYFATWCIPCADEAQELEAFDKEYGDTYKLLIIDRGETGDRVKSFMKKHKTTSTYLLDKNDKVSKTYGVIAQPETFVIDKDGVIQEYVQGEVTKEDLISLTEKY